MKYLKLNEGWNADPNIPNPEAYTQDNTLYLDFFLNYHIYKGIHRGQKGQLKFNECYMYRFGSPNDHGFSLKQFRYGPDDIPWGEFYELFESDWKNDFPDDKIVLNQDLEEDKELRHFLFFFRDECFECIAKDFNFNYLKAGEINSGNKVYPKT